MPDGNKNPEHNPIAATTAPSSAALAQFSEDEALAFLDRAEVNSQQIAELARSSVTLKSRKVLVRLVAHPRTPRHVSIPLLRRMFTFDLMQTAVTPAVAADIKRAAEEQMLIRLESLAAGEKITLARRASGRIAASLLQENDERVVAPALDNPQLTEALVVQALMKPRAPEILYVLVSSHAKWSLRREIQIALLRSEKTPVERAREFAQHFPPDFLKQIVPEERIALLLPR